jgi:uncharacterized SAM-binding protein YcdF (DUF218 family)
MMGAMRFVLSLFRRRAFRWLVSIGVLGTIFGLGCICIFVVTQFDGNATFPADCGIVFGTAVRPLRDERGAIVYAAAGPGIMRRVETAADLYRQGSLRRIYLSGGRGEGMPESEAEVMRRMAVVHGVANEDLTIEERSTSTRENLIFTQPLAKHCASVVAISDRYHLARIRVLAWLQGWKLQTYPADRHATKAFEVRSVMREVLGIVAAFGGY